MTNVFVKSCVRLLLPAAAAVLLVAPTASAIELDDELAAHSGWQFPGDGHWREVDRIEGTWNVKVTFTLCDAAGLPTDTPVPGTVPVDAMSLFAANGTFHDTNESNPALRSAGFGNWRRIGHRSYQFAFKFFRFNAALPTPPGPQIIRHTVVLARDGRTYTSRGTAEWFDADNNPAPPFKTCSTSTATRFR